MNGQGPGTETAITLYKGRAARFSSGGIYFDVLSPDLLERGIYHASLSFDLIADNEVLAEPGALEELRGLFPEPAVFLNAGDASKTRPFRLVVVIGEEDDFAERLADNRRLFT